MATTEYPHAVKLRRDAPPRLLVGQDAVTATSARAVAVTSDGAVKVSLDGGTVTIAHADLNVQLNGFEATATESDSVIAVGTENGAQNGTPHALKVAADGALEVVQPVAADLNCTEASAAGILAQLDVTLSTVATEATLATIDADTSALAAAIGIHDDTTLPANAVVVGGIASASSSPPAAVAEDDVVRAWFDLYGAQMVSNAYVQAGEDLANKTQVVEERWALGSGGIIAVSGTAHNAPCRVACLLIAETGAANPVTCYLRDGGAAGTIMTPTIYVAAGQSKEVWFSLPFGTDVYATIGGAGTASVAVYRHAGGP